ncbi:Kinesin-like protein kif20a [Puccinia graminis f. sp. tritici]|uniref:Kinesin-like protein kif20a n=1 Tax=Puccinia graminis f. sp. tritici TaxID=56615 RepID=A0A5B0SL52_PUCGR|nr:Kinesin-like protein kif20a [Puccinia graminis f. sp. tritici]
MDPIPGIGIGSLHPIQSQCIGQLGSGGAIQYRYLVLGPFSIRSPINTDPGIRLLTVWMIPKCKAYSPQRLGSGSRPDRDCNVIPIPIRYHFDTIPWDQITLSNLIPFFSIPGIEKSIRSDKLADTVSDRICFTVGR